MAVFSQQPNRIDPALPVAAYKTYAVAAPAATHWRPASCEEAGCGAWADGWWVVADETTDLGAGQARYIRVDSGRGFTEHRTADGRTAFRFEPGQRCFASSTHRVPLDRPEIYVVRGGDWRGNPSGQVRRHVYADDWVDDFGTHQQRVADAVERG